MLKTEQKESFWKLMKGFVRKKSGEFWVWDLLGDASTDNQTRLGFFAKSLTCKTKPEMSIKVREKTAFLLLDLGHKAEALAELNTVVRIRTKNNWSIPPLLSSTISSLNKENIAPSKDNNAFFCELAGKAELLILDKPTQPKGRQRFDFEGKIMINEKGFGFVRSGEKTIFIPPKLLSTKNISNLNIVCGQYTVSFDHKKNKEGFAAISINKK